MKITILTDSATGLGSGAQQLFNYLQSAQATSIRKMVRAMDVRSPAPINARLRHLHDKGFIRLER